MKFKILSLLIVAGFAIQFIPYGKDLDNPPVVSEPHWDSPETKKMFFSICGNCHSNATKYPFYKGVAPISWLIQHDVHEGRKHFNVSMWTIQQPNKGNQAAGKLESGDMPPRFYVIGHPEAKLSETEKSVLISGLKQTFNQEVTDKSL